MLAAIEGNFIGAISLLVESGANIEIGANTSSSAIETAVEKADTPAVLAMLKYPLQVAHVISRINQLRS